MLDDKKKQRLKNVGLVLVCALAVIYSVALFDGVNSMESDISSIQTDISSMQSDIDSIKSDVDTIEDEVESMQNDVSSIESKTRR